MQSYYTSHASTVRISYMHIFVPNLMLLYYKFDEVIQKKYVASIHEFVNTDDELLDSDTVFKHMNNKYEDSWF